MGLFSRVLGKDTKPRTRICVECGMPPADHKEWCAIRRAQVEMEANAGRDAAGAPAPANLEP